MKKTYLFAPGPTPIPPEVLLAMAQPILHHRTPQFQSLFGTVLEDLKYVFQTDQPVLVLASSGTGAMEAAVTNLLSPGEEAVTIRGGKFGERWAEICEAYGIRSVNIDVEWGKAVDPQIVEDTVKAHPKVKAVLWQASETSTGVRHPTKELAEICREHSVLSVVDGITAIGVFDVPMDAWKLDVVVSGSQKAFMLPPGLAFIALSERAWARMEESRSPKYYFDLKKEKKSQSKADTAYTPAVSMIMGLKVSLDLIKTEGLKKVFARHALLAEATREAMKALGLELLAPGSPSDAVTAVKVPSNVDGGAITKTLRDKYGVTIAGGQSQLKGKIFRISHMGYVSKADILLIVGMTEVALKELGYDLEPGRGVSRAQEILFQE